MQTINTKTEEELVDISKELLGHILSLAQLGLEREKFRYFKKEAFHYFHNQFRKDLRQVIERNSKVMAVPSKDNLAGKELHL